MKKHTAILAVALLAALASYGEDAGCGFGFDFGSSNYFLADDAFAVLPAIAAGINANIYVPYTETVSSYIEANVMTESDFLSPYPTLIYGMSADASYREGILTARAEVTSKGRIAVSDDLYEIEAVPKLQLIVGNLDFSFYTHHSLVMTHLESFALGYRAVAGIAFPVFDVIVLETEAESFIDATSITATPRVRFSAYPHPNVSLSGEAGVGKTFALGDPPDPEPERTEFHYRFETSIFFLTRSKSVIGIEGYSRFHDDSSIPNETVLNPSVKTEIELSKTLSVGITGDIHLYIPPSVNTGSIDGNVSVLLRFFF